jgi:hypothetical protein
MQQKCHNVIGSIHFYSVPTNVIYLFKRRLRFTRSFYLRVSFNLVVMEILFYMSVKTQQIVIHIYGQE